jgi:hypothetical protein
VAARRLEIFGLPPVEMAAAMLRDEVPVDGGEG